MSIIGTIVLLFSVYLLASFIKSLFEKKDEFFANEAQRVFLKNAELKDNWSPHGRVYTKGISIVKKEGSKDEYKIIPQAKVCDIGLY